MKECLNFPKLSNWMTIVVIFDGVQRGQIENLNWPFCFLPSNLPPEELLRDVVTNHINEVAEKLNTTTDLLHMILGSIEGLSRFARYTPQVWNVGIRRNPQ